MRSLLLFILIIPFTCRSQPLMKIKTKEQAGQYIKEHFTYFNHKYDSFKVDTADLTYDSFRKADFNRDGVQDLLVFGTAYVSLEGRSYEQDEIVLLAGDLKNVRKMVFPYRFFRSLSKQVIPYPEAIRFEQKDYLQIHYEIFDRAKQEEETFTDTLFVKNDHLIPYTAKPDNELITRIEFKTTHCLGSCPVFEISIDKALNVEYEGIEYVDKTGQRKLKADRKHWEYLTVLINHLKVRRLEDKYAVSWTDDQTGFLTVSFKDGTQKQIEDYGLRGSFGLSILYDYFFELSKF